jgi:diaminohydroxyphosphoribosylaminopyrimidine deaminase/5-amino-6-(5-phosphoribosylamino)uracil reductase
MSFSAFDHECMAMALRLAKKGLNTTHPNPRVGCVIAANNEILGIGWHRQAGQAHAEIIALQEAGGRAQGATAYVTLEPCDHQGRTPPCVNALIDAGIARVVYANEDPNPDVSGKGAQRLRASGLEVQGGLMAAQGEALNAGFFKRMRSHRPWVRVKLAQSVDGHIALANGSSQWISSAESRRDVQAWRARSDVILTGVGTVLADDPSLNVRLEGHRRQPVRVIVDSHWRTPADARLLGLDGEVIIAGLDRETIPATLKAGGAECIICPENRGRVDLKVLLAMLAERELNEVQVEAGATLCGGLLKDGLVDELLIYQAPVILGGGARSPFAAPRLDNMQDRVHLQWIDTRRIGPDMRLRLKPL